MSTVIEAIFLDLGGVVLELDWKRTFTAVGMEFDAEIVERLGRADVFHRFERGEASPEEYFAFLAQLTGSRLGHAELVSAWNGLIVGELKGIQKVFDTFLGRVPVCALSNTNITHMVEQFPKIPVLARFDRIFTSCELGFRKPDPQIYLAAAAALDIAPERAAFIDDLAVNVEGARQVGFQAFQSINDTAHTLKLLNELKYAR
jgi:FMN phosphatase YigB (HAD superfamily)